MMMPTAIAFSVTIFLVQSVCFHATYAYSNPNYPHVGKQCPCFCSVRSGDGASPYWDNTFGAEVTEAKCNTTSCLKPEDYTNFMPFCKDTVTYKFCPRQFDNNFINLQGEALITKLDAHAKACHEESMLDSDENLRRSTTEDHKKCATNVKKGACYTVFPECSSNMGNSAVKPLGICTSFCKHERESCRAENSFVGDQRTISEGCSEAPWVVNSRWVDGVWIVDQNSQGICMGHGSPVFAHLSVVALCISCFSFLQLA